MIAGIDYFEKIMEDNNYDYTSLEKGLKLKSGTLSVKIKGEKDLKVSEAINIANILKMDKQQCLECFFVPNLHKV